MNAVNSKRLAIVTAVIYALVQLTLTISVIVLQIDAINARKAAVRQRDYMTCILQILPQNRTDNTVKECRQKNA